MPLGFFDLAMPSVLVWMLLNASILTTGPQIAYQCRAGTLRHMFSTPLRMGSWLAGTVLGLQLLACVQLLVLWGVGIAYLGAQAPRNLPGTVVILMLSSAAGLGIGLIIATFAPSVQAANPLAVIVSTGLGFLGQGVVASPLPEPLHALMLASPSFRMARALQQVMMKGQPLAAVLPDLGGPGPDGSAGAHPCGPAAAPDRGRRDVKRGRDLVTAKRETRTGLPNAGALSGCQTKAYDRPRAV